MKNKLNFILISIILIGAIFSAIACKKEDNNKLIEISKNETNNNLENNNIIKNDKDDDKDLSEEDKKAKDIILAFLNGNPDWDNMHIPDSINLDAMKEWYKDYKESEDFQDLRNFNGSIKDNFRYYFDNISEKLMVEDFFANNIYVKTDPTTKFSINGVDFDKDIFGISYDVTVSSFVIPETLKTIKLVVPNKVMGDLVIEEEVESRDTILLSYYLDVYDCVDREAFENFVNSFYKDLIQYKKGNIDLDEFLKYFNKNLDKDFVNTISYNTLFDGAEAKKIEIEYLDIRKVIFSFNDGIYTKGTMKVFVEDNPEKTYILEFALEIRALENNQFEIAEIQKAKDILYK